MTANQSEQAYIRQQKAQARLMEVMRACEEDHGAYTADDWFRVLHHLQRAVLAADIDKGKGK